MMKNPQIETTQIDLGVQYRELADIEIRDIDEEKRLIQVAFSSDNPVEDFFGFMILDHDRTSVRLDRADKGLVPALFNHDRNLHLGKVQGISLDSDGIGRGFVKFSRSQLAEEKFQDVLNGDLSGVSVGFRIHEAILERTSDDGDIFRAIDWEVLEISLVTLPRDITVGVGRTEGDRQKVIIRKEVKQCQTRLIQKNNRRLIILK